MAEMLDRAASDDAVRFGPLAGSLGLLLRLSQLHSFADFYGALSRHAVRPGEMSILMMIRENPGIRQGVLAKALMIKRAHMTKMARRLEEAGLIRRTVPEDDRRAMELRLTPQGRARVAAMAPDLEAHEAQSFGGLTAKEAATLRTLLRKYLALEAPKED